jgi:hypothetical protein
MWETFEMAEKKSKGYKVDSNLLSQFEREMELAGASDGLVYEALIVHWMESTPEQRMQLTRRLVDWKKENGVGSGSESDDEPSAGKIAPAGQRGNRIAARKPHDRGTTG